MIHRGTRFLVTLAWFLFACGIIGISSADKPKIRGFWPEGYANGKFDDKEFTCLDNSKTIPFRQVNDNYCDCPDASDEPGTSACPNGRFWCRNIGHVGNFIFSSQVGDGICDCCDGSDEREEGKTTCQNLCLVWAEAKRKEQEKEIERQKEGLQQRKQLIEESEKKIQEKKDRLKMLKEDLDTLKEEKERLEEVKKKIEEEEKQKKEQEAKEREEKERQEKEAKEKEAEEKKGEEGQAEEKPKEEEHVEPVEEPIHPVDDEESEEDSYDDEDDHDRGKLSSALQKAKEEFDEASKKLKDAENEIKDLEKELSFDYGADNEFFYMQGECYSVSTTEYTYELCPFDKATQKPKSGGSTTNLGKWDNTKQPPEWEKNHSKMLYSGGARCWGGPDRSLTVEIFCDKETRVADPAEPNKCEYTIKLYTPAACKEEQLKVLEAELEASKQQHLHDEL